MGVFLGQAEIGQIAGRQHQVGRRVEAIEGGDQAPQMRFGVDNAIGQFAFRAHVKVGDLSDQHEMAPPFDDVLTYHRRLTV